MAQALEEAKKLLFQSPSGFLSSSDVLSSSKVRSNILLFQSPSGFLSSSDFICQESHEKLPLVSIPIGLSLLFGLACSRLDAIMMLSFQSPSGFLSSSDGYENTASGGISMFQSPSGFLSSSDGIAWNISRLRSRFQSPSGFLSSSDIVDAVQV